MSELPSCSSIQALRTDRLFLQAVRKSDTQRLVEIACDPQIAKYTRAIEFPFDSIKAERWIDQHRQLNEDGEAAVWGIYPNVKQSEGQRGETVSKLPEAFDGLLGVVGLAIDISNLNAELGFWMGRSYWGVGIASEAVAAALGFAFENKGLHRVHGHHMAENLGSGRVMQKAGMKLEGCLSQHVLVDGAFHDVQLYGLLADDWQRMA